MTDEVRFFEVISIGVDIEQLGLGEGHQERGKVILVDLRCESPKWAVPDSVELSLGHVCVHVGGDDKHPSRAMSAVQPAAISVVSSHQLLRRCLSGYDSKN